MVLPDVLMISAPALTSITSTAEKSAMTRPPQQPPTQVFAQQRGSGCGTLLVALLVLAIITAIVIFLGAFGLLDWIFS
jgi:magnesium-transporting ATPase (P-type)